MAQWSNAVAIPNQTTKTAPALAYFDDVLHLLHLGGSSDNIWYSFFDGTKWTPNVQTGLKSRGAVAFAPPTSDPGRGLLAYRSSEQAPDGGYGILYTLSFGRHDTWPPGRLLPEKFTSDNPVALTTDRQGRWVMVIVISNSRSMRVARYVPTSGFPHRVALVETDVIPNQTTKAVPVLASHLGRIHLLHLGGSSNNIWHSVDFGPNVRVPNQTSKAPPAMAVYKGDLHMVHLGNSSENLWHSTLGEQGWTPNVRIPGQSSSSYPALAATPDGLHLVYKGADSNRIWHSIYR